MEKLHAWAGPSGVMKLVLGQECMHQKRVLCNCRMWPPWGLKIVTNPSSIFINKSWSPWTAGQEKEISTRLRVFLWRTSSSTRTTKWAVDKAINHSTHIHLPFSRSWLIMQKVDLLKAWPEMVWFSRIFFQDCSMMMILIPGKAWQFVLFSLFLVLTVRILLTSSWPGQFWNFVFSLRWREESLLEFPKWAFRLSTLLCWGLGLKKAWLSGMGQAQWGWWHLPEFYWLEATRGVNEREKVWHVEMGSWSFFVKGLHDLFWDFLFGTRFSSRLPTHDCSMTPSGCPCWMHPEFHPEFCVGAKHMLQLCQ